MHLNAYNSDVTWGLEIPEEVSAWMLELPDKDYEHIIAALEALAVDGPNLGRPFVDRVEGSRHQNMKELRPLGGNYRLLFAFDPRRQAIFLVAGDKTNDWQNWYKRNIPLADKKFDKHLRNLKRRKGHA